MIIPYSSLSPEALRGVVESFVLREGTEYGERDVTLAEKVDAVIAQLERGQARIVFDSEAQSVDIVPVP
ncbi:MAG: YheU family protein [Gammaproteobacteria bacterium]|nr:YheU family protein [Gammaproteobacteria bacterium]